MPPPSPELASSAVVGPKTEEVIIMGKFDRRHSQKMKRREAQAKKKGRAAKKVEDRKVRLAATGKKQTGKKPAAV